MKNISTLKSTKIESPKTPGGISKSLLTPCRRVGLSRNWKKAGPSPFVSPLSSSNSSSVEVKIEKKEPKKRKQRAESEEKDEIGEEQRVSNTYENVDENGVSELSTPKTDDISSTPTRHIEIPRKKKSKTLLTVLKTDLNATTKENIVANSKENLDTENINHKVQNEAIPVRKSKTKKSISQKASPTLEDTSKCESADNQVKDNNINREISEDEPVVSKPKSPNELTKECIVVIQKKIFKTDKKNKRKEQEKVGSQVLFDSDCDDVPLCQLNKEKMVDDQSTEEKIIEKPEDDFIEIKSNKIKKLENKATSIGGLKKTKLSIHKTNKKSSVYSIEPVTNNSDFDDDEDDFDLTNKKTILIRKTYEKVNKPQKAKSTGSITQKDIDELKARIEAKKKMLLAKAMTEDTDELRSLIRKWQKGCQDALMELMDLMKNKFPDKHNMEYSEMLSMLKIPKQLVGYDEENDCFNTPDDKDFILAKFQEL